MIRELENVSYGRGTKRIDRLSIVTDDGKAAAIRLQRQQDRELKPVRVDHHVIETIADVVCKRAVRRHLGPVEHEIIVVEYVLSLLCVDVTCKQTFQLGGPKGTPWEGLAKHLLEGASAFTQCE
jgi:hypothetical protein